jgi:phenylpropionate dioxygenase-like ring-hydroxylating dioxygenase large terminal subunit
MGALMRQYWLPALPSSEFSEPDGPAKRMRLLGENLVMFRDTKGEIGALAEACPHRGASLYFGRNEECGLRCSYHGWKFDVRGNCIDLPTEPDAQRRASFQSKIKAQAYPCRDVNHMIWIYMGPRKEPPPFPVFEVNTLPAAHVGKPNIMMEEANWLQNLEGDLDSNHLDWLHRRLKADSAKPKLGMRGFWNSDQRAPRLDVVTTEYGAYYTAKRTLPEGDEWHRINQFIFPFHSMITGGISNMIGLRSFVPVDDYHTMLISQGGRVDKPIGEQQMFGGPDAFNEVGGYIERTHDPRSYFLTKANKRNDYFRDRSVEKESMFNGVPFVMNLQDRAMTELMCDADGNPIYDRTQEHLGSSDMMVIAVRRQLLQATLRLQDGGSPPANVDNVRLDRVRSATLRLPIDADWKTISEAARNSDSGRPPAADLPMIN